MAIGIRRWPWSPACANCWSYSTQLPAFLPSLIASWKVLWEMNNEQEMAVAKDRAAIRRTPRLRPGHRPQIAANQGQGREIHRLRGGQPVRRVAVPRHRQRLAWCDTVANRRVHATAGERPAGRLGVERAALGPLPDRASPAPYLMEERRVSGDGFVSWEGSYYGVPWRWAAERASSERASIDLVPVL